jgi:hypothetical protein
MAFSFLKRETKEQKVVREIKEKKVQIDKLKEEITNMAKLQIVNGKIVKTQDVPQTPTTSQPTQTPPTPQPTTNPNMDFEQEVMREKIKRQLLEQQQQSQQNEMLRRQMLQEQERQLVAQQQAIYEQQQSQLQQEDMLMQQQVQQQQQVEQEVEVVLRLTNDSEFKMSVSVNEIGEFIKDINTAIEHQTPFNIGDHTINTRHLMMYTIIVQ